MKDFVMAVLTWVMAGLALAVLAGSSAERKKAEKRGGQIALGLLLGVTLNGCDLWENHALGLAPGPLWAWHWPAFTGMGKRQKEIPIPKRRAKPKNCEPHFEIRSL